jgi:hypothetical protein
VSGIWIAAFVTLWLVVILIGLVQLGTLRRVAPLLERTESTLREAARGSLRGLRPGETVPAFAAEVFGGGTFTEADLQDSTTIVLFLNTSCGSCELLAADLEAGRVANLDIPLVVVADEPDDAARFAAGGQAQVLLQENASLARAFESDRTPHAFVIDEAGRVVASGTPNTWQAMASLLDDVGRGGDRELDVACGTVGVVEGSEKESLMHDSEQNEKRSSRSRFLRQLGVTMAAAVGAGALAARASAFPGDCCYDCSCGTCNGGCWCRCDCGTFTYCMTHSDGCRTTQHACTICAC